jgi:hypothetical protein
MVYDYDLIHVIWGSRHVIVSLKQGKALFHVSGKLDDDANATIPTIKIEDSDFLPLKEPTWKDVSILLSDKVFFHSRLMVHPKQRLILACCTVQKMLEDGDITTVEMDELECALRTYRSSKPKEG